MKNYKKCHYKNEVTAKIFTKQKIVRMNKTVFMKLTSSASKIEKKKT